MASRPQKLASLQALQGDLATEQEKLQRDLAAWTEAAERRRAAVAELERTIAELRKVDGEREGLKRSAVECLRPVAKAPAGAPKPAVVKTDGPTPQEIDLSFRFASALANAQVRTSTEPPQRLALEDYDRVFGGEAAAEEEQLSAEQRLFRELENPATTTERLDVRLYNELRRNGKEEEAELLAVAVGAPTLKEMQNRPLLLLLKHTELDASYASAAAAGASLLHLACRRGFVDVAYELLSRGADVQHLDNAGSSALREAYLTKHWACVVPLLEHKADPTGVGDDSPLMLAAGLPEADVLPALRSLLEFAADPNVARSDGQTPLMRAAGINSGAVCRALVEARADVGGKDADGRTARLIAMSAGHLALATWLDSLK